MTANGTLDLQNGVAATSTNTLGVSSSGSVSRTNGHVFGNLQMFLGTGDIAAKTFHIGTATHYTPATVDIDGGGTGTAGTLTATTTGSAHSQIGSSGLDTDKDIERYWTLMLGTADLGGRSYKLKVEFLSGDVPNGASTSNFELRRYDGTWHTPTGGTYTRTGTSTQYDNFTSFSDFAVGEPTIVEPTTQAHDITFSSVGTTSMTVSWTNGDGSSRLVLAKADSAVDADPVDGTGYTANSTFGSGNELGTGNFVLFSGSGNSAAVSGLTPATTYHFRVYEFNGSGATADYLTSTATDNPNSETTLTVLSSESDVIAVAASEAATISSLMNNASPLGSSDGVRVWQVTIRDGGGSPDADALPTILTAITFSQAASGNTVTDWSADIFAADLFDGTTRLASGTVGTSTIAFTGLSVSAPDDGSKTLSLRISLKNPLPANSDRKSFRLRVTSANVTAASSATSSQFSSFADAVSADGQNVIDVRATKLAFTTQPQTSKLVGENIGPVSVTARDANDNTDLDFTGAVTLSSGTFTLASTDGGGLTKSAVLGVVSWTNLTSSTAATGSVVASADGLADASVSIRVFSTSATSVQEGNWTEDATWNQGMPPFAGQIAEVLHHVTIGSPVNAAEVTVRDGGVLEALVLWTVNAFTLQNGGTYIHNATGSTSDCVKSWFVSLKK